MDWQIPPTVIQIFLYLIVYQAPSPLILGNQINI